MKKILLSAASLLMIFPSIPMIATAAPASARTQERPEERTKIFSGTIYKDRDNFILLDKANNMSYILDDPRQASRLEGKKAKVTGTVDAVNDTIHVETIQEIA